MKYSVPIIEETTYIYEVEARNGYDAAGKAAVRHADPEGKPDHEHKTKSTMGKILPTVEGAKLTALPGGAEHTEPAAAAKDPRKP